MSTCACATSERTRAWLVGLGANTVAEAHDFSDATEPTARRLQKHMDEEERIVFPRLLRLGIAHHAEITRLRLDHDRFRALLRVTTAQAIEASDLFQDHGQLEDQLFGVAASVEGQ